MKWVIFTGNWKVVNSEVASDVKQEVRRVLSNGDGIVTGGATGVDYICMEEYLKLDPTCTRIRIFIPAKLGHYIADYRKNWCHAPVTQEDITKLEEVLIKIKSTNPACIFEVRKSEGDIHQFEYDLRHNEEVTFADEVMAFHVNESRGTQDTIDKAAAAGLKIVLHKKYKIEVTA
jgi:hypothetical protein